MYKIYFKNDSSLTLSSLMGISSNVVDSTDYTLIAEVDAYELKHAVELTTSIENWWWENNTLSDVPLEYQRDILPSDIIETNNKLFMLMGLGAGFKEVTWQ